MSEDKSLISLKWKFYFFITFACMWLIYALKSKWAYRVTHLLLSRFVGFVAFQYNRGIRHKFIKDFDLRDPPRKSGDRPKNKEALGEDDRGDKDELKPDQMGEMVSFSIDEFLRRHNKIPYVIARSVCNEVAQRLTCYVHEYQSDDIKENAVFKMIHMDYWADMEYWLLLMKPIIMYSFVPEGVGGSITGGTFCSKNDLFRTVREDGTSHEHMLWDYGYEYLTIETCWGVIICPIEQFKIPEEPHYRIIFIVPTTFVPVPFSSLVQRRKLERLRVSFGSQNVLRVLDSFGREYMSLSTPGSCVDCTVPSDLFDILKIKHENSRLSIRSIEKFLRKEGVAKEHILAALIYEVFKQHDYPPDKSRKTRILPCEDVRYLVPREPTSATSLSPVANGGGPAPQGKGGRKRTSRTFIPTGTNTGPGPYLGNTPRGSRTVVMGP